MKNYRCPGCREFISEDMYARVSGEELCCNCEKVKYKEFSIADKGLEEAKDILVMVTGNLREATDKFQESSAKLIAAIEENSEPEETGIFLVQPGTSVFVDAPEYCAKSPDKKHNWDGEEVNFGNGCTSTCKHCGMWAINYDMMTAP